MSCAKHKLRGYCIRGGKDIAERIRKVFEADGVQRSGFGYHKSEAFYFIMDMIGYGLDIFHQDKREEYPHLTEITISEAEAIVYGTPEKTFPREMLVSDDEEGWYKTTIVGYCEHLDTPWLVDNSADYFTGYRFARELPETIPYNRAKEIISKATSKGVDEFEIESKTE